MKNILYGTFEGWKRSRHNSQKEKSNHDKRFGLIIKVRHPKIENVTFNPERWKGPRELRSSDKGRILAIENAYPKWEGVLSDPAIGVVRFADLNEINLYEDQLLTGTKVFSKGKLENGIPWFFRRSRLSAVEYGKHFVIYPSNLNVNTGKHYPLSLRHEKNLIAIGIKQAFSYRVSPFIFFSLTGQGDRRYSDRHYHAGTTKRIEEIPFIGAKDQKLVKKDVDIKGALLLETDSGNSDTGNIIPAFTDAVINSYLEVSRRCREDERFDDERYRIQAFCCVGSESIRPSWVINKIFPKTESKLPRNVELFSKVAA